MSNTIAYNLARLQAAKTAIGNAITQKGGTVNAGDGLEDYSADILTIPASVSPTITTNTATADLTGYEAGDTSLGDGFTLYVANGSAQVDSETVDGVTYSGLALTVDATVAKSSGTFVLGQVYQTAEFEFIERSITNTTRIMSTGGVDWEGSIYFLDSSDYMYFCCYGATKLDYDHQVNIDSSTLYDTSITKNGVLNKVLNIKYVYSNDHITLYVNNVAKLRWDAINLNRILNGYSLHVGANGAGQNDMLLTKAEYRGELLTWDGRTWVPA